MGKTVQNIILVEDDPIIKFTMSKTLKKIYQTVDVAENGQVGLNKILENEYDIIITDLSMPVMDGYQMIKELRSLGENTPVIVCSAYSFDEQEKYNCKLISKPVIIGSLIKLINTITD